MKRIPDTFSIINLTRGNSSGDELPFAALKDAVLGKRYRLSLVFTTRERIKALNRVYRGKNRATDILSFPLSPSDGEIFMCPLEARKEAKRFGRPYQNFLLFLFIHGLAHLKGMRHGSKMEALERKFRKKFNI